MANDIAAVIGLGNPGDKYVRTRHNAGFWLIDRLAAECGASWRNQARLHGDTAQVDIAGSRIQLLKPMTFMNNSGRAARALLDFYKLEPEQILVAYDELDLPAGTIRMKRGGGAGGHNGMKDLISCLGPDFARMRIGIGHPGDRDKVLGYVLSQPGADDRKRIESIIDLGVEAIRDLPRQGWDRTVQRLHT